MIQPLKDNDSKNTATETQALAALAKAGNAL